MRLRLAVFAALLTAPAFAQTPPTVEQVREDANALIAAVRQQRDINADQLAQAMAQIAKLQKELDAAKKVVEPAK